MKITCVSDLHGYYPKLEGGDLLIVAGDLTAKDDREEYIEFRNWLKSQDYKRKIFICGNHDGCIQKGLFLFGKTWMGADYLCDSGTEFEGLKIWGSPWSKRFVNMNPCCMAFTVDTEEELANKWKNIPYDTDILITHSPPYDYLDHIKNEFGDRKAVGSISLYEKILDIYPKLHVFGHIHEEYGIERRDFFPTCSHKKIIFVNASHVNERYQPVNEPIRIEL